MLCSAYQDLVVSLMNSIPWFTCIEYSIDVLVLIGSGIFPID